MFIPTLRLTLSFACLAAACGPAGQQDADARAPGSQQPSERAAGLAPSLAKDRPPERAPMAISSLVPDGSYAWIRLASFDQLDGLMNEFMHVLAGLGGPDFEAALSRWPIERILANIDRERELGFALGFAAGSTEPAVTVMLPVLDRGAVIQGFRDLPEPPQCFGIDDYVVATSLVEYRPGLGSARLTEGLPPGLLTARVDFRTLIKQFGPLLELGLERMTSAPQGEVGGARASLLAALRVAAKSGEQLDLALDLEGGEVDLSITLVVAPDSELDGAWPRSAGNLYDLARCLEGGDTASMLLTIDGATLHERLLPLYGQVLDAAASRGELEAPLQALLLEWGQLAPLFGDSLAVSINADGDSCSLTNYFKPQNRDTFMGTMDAGLRAIARDVPALRISPPVQGSVDTAYTLSFEGGASSMARAATLRIAARREVTAITVSDDEHAMSEALARIARAEAQLPESLAYVMDRIGHANPAFLARIDLAVPWRDLLARLAGQPGRGLPEAASPAADEEPLYLTCYGGVDGRLWRFGVRADVSRFGRLIKE